jgi:hypothetical protein
LPDATEEQINEGLSTTPAQARPISAQGIFLRTAQDPDEALSGTLEGIASQSDWGIRSTLALQFVGAHPDLKSALENGLSARGIKVYLPQEE